jgi:hypothetical protein
VGCRGSIDWVFGGKLANYARALRLASNLHGGIALSNMAGVFVVHFENTAGSLFDHLAVLS